ncbi:sulfatase family protein [Cohnella fermenti]|nr:sulfatase-like hydrolase/transferase [Cohnella fermenti]
MAARRKNIILLMTDQHRLDHVSYPGSGRLSTPNIDRIAEGIGFTNCISVNPVCSPARSALLTGKYTHQIGLTAMSGDLSLQHPTYLRALQDHGYRTFGIGKLHWLQGWKFGGPIGHGHPLTRLRDDIRQFGLDEVWEVAGKQLVSRNYCEYAAHLDKQGLLEEYREFNARSGTNTYLAEKQNFTGESFPFGEHNYLDIVIGDKIVETIEQKTTEEPFMLFGSFVGPHPPYDPPASYLDPVPYEEEDDFTPGRTVRLRTIRSSICTECAAPTKR